VPVDSCHRTHFNDFSTLLPRSERFFARSGVTKPATGPFMRHFSSGGKFGRWYLASLMAARDARRGHRDICMVIPMYCTGRLGWLLSRAQEPRSRSGDEQPGRAHGVPICTNGWRCQNDRTNWDTSRGRSTPAGPPQPILRTQQRFNGRCVARIADARCDFLRGEAEVALFFADKHVRWRTSGVAGSASQRLSG